MSDSPRGPGWWMADDGRWYAPELRDGTSTRPPAPDDVGPADAPTLVGQPTRVVPGSPDMPPAASPPAGPAPPVSPEMPRVRSGRGPLIAVAGAVVALALIVGVVVLVGSGGSDDSEDLAASDSETTTTEPAPTTERPSTTASTTVAGDGGDSGPLDGAGRSAAEAQKDAPGPAPRESRDPDLLAAGLFCRDLAAQGYSYSAAVDYWRSEGLPDRMDADRNGIPCETVYPRSDVVSYWPGYAESIPVTAGLPSGLLCRDLAARGIGVYDALRYYVYEGSPTRMDADNNGVPCETVYPDAAEVWFSGF